VRPLELSLRNFRSYREPEVVFDFRGRSLVGIVGPIGAGKSSLLDGIAFALYGKTPSEGAATTTLIHQRADQGGVRFRFEVDGEIWEAVRVLRRKGQSRHDLYRYAEDTAEAERVETITQERHVNDRVRKLLGLDFDTFGRSVLLAQGRFAEFLRGQPRDRNRVLKGVFGHDRIDRMRDAAKAHAGELAQQVAGVDGQLVQIEARRAQLETKVAELEEAEARLEVLSKAEPTVDDLDARIAEARSSAAEAERRRDEILPLGEQLPATELATELAGRLEQLTGRRRELGEAMDEAATARQEADALLAELEDADEQDLIERADRAINAARQAADELAAAVAERDRVAAQLDQRRADQTATGADLARAAADEQRCREGVTAAEESADRARAEQHRASHRNMAAELRRELSAGEECPVCRQPVEALPPSAPAPDLDGAESAVADAEAAVRAATDLLGRATAETVRLQARASALDEEAGRLEADLVRGDQEVATRRLAADACEVEVATLLGEGDPVELLAWRRQRLGDARKAVAAAARSFDVVSADHKRVVDEVIEAQARIDELRRVVDRVAGRLGIDEVEDVGDSERFGVFAATVRERWTVLVAEAQRNAAEAAADLTAAAAERADVMAELGVTADFRDVLTAARATTEQLVKSVAAERAAIAEADELTAARTSLAAAAALHERIARDLTDSNFVRYLLDDERARLAELGGEHFMRLTSGHYRFTDDGQFDIVDLNYADAERKASSLSGGETFLASLSLALALAEMVTGTGGRLDAFFLDEGFGSLDPEHLDLAMTGIEDLVADGSSRLVVVVSHVPELRDRIGDLIELGKDPVTGDTRVKAGAAARSGTAT
jgi:exonuclease SbcC